MRRLLAGMIILAVPASAQNTNCQLYGNSVNCQTTQPSKGVDWAGFAEQQHRQSEQDDVDSKAQSVRNRERFAGRLVAEGRCDEARAMALKSGDFALARNVTEACTK